MLKKEKVWQVRFWWDGNVTIAYRGSSKVDALAVYDSLKQKYESVCLERVTQ